MNAGEKDRLATVLALTQEMVDTIEYESQIIKGSPAHKAILENYIFHISEIVHNYLREFKAKHKKIDWQEFRKIRNSLAHSYSFKGYKESTWAATHLIPETIAQLEAIEASKSGKSSSFLRVKALRGPLVKYFGTKKKVRSSGLANCKIFLVN